MVLRTVLSVLPIPASMLCAFGCRGPLLELGDGDACSSEQKTSCVDGAAEVADSGSFALFRIETDDYTRAGETTPRRSYAFLGDSAYRAWPAPLRFGCLDAFETDASGQCVSCTDEALPRSSAASGPFTGSDVRVHSVTAAGGELPGAITMRWDGINAPGPTTDTVSSTRRAWGDGGAVQLTASFFSDAPIANPDGDPLLEAKATLLAPRYLILTPGSPERGKPVRREEDLVFEWAPREGTADPAERVRITLETRSEDFFDQDHRSTGRVRRVSCEFESAARRGAIPAAILRQMSRGEKLSSLTSLSSAEVVGPLHPGVHIPWLVRYELRSVVRDASGEALDTITLE